MVVFQYMDPREYEGGGWEKSGNKQFSFITSGDSAVGSSCKM